MNIRATGRAATLLPPQRAPVDPPAQAPRTGHRRDIQGLRAVAVLLVIANHAGLPGFGGGYVGVDVFFVISGYVITRLLLRETGSGVRQGLADFYCRRIRRIAPAATATLIATVLAASALLGPHLAANLPGDVRWAALFAANFRLVATGSSYFVPGLHPSLVTQFWSLAVEEQFYLLFPPAVFLIARVTARRHRRWAMPVALAVAIGASAWWSVRISGADPVSAYYSPLTRFWELGLGCLLATAAVRPAGRRSAGAAAVLGAALLAAAVSLLDADSVYPGWRAWLPCGGCALLLWAGAGGVPTPVSRVLSSRPLGYLGDLSFSLYLVHYAWLNLAGQLAHPLTGPLWRAGELAGLFLTAMCSYHFLENPVRRSRRLAADRAATALTLAVCVAASWTATLSVAWFASR